MHANSLDLMRRFIERYTLDILTRGVPFVVDVGSRDVNGTFRTLFPGRSWHYVGLDCEAGKNVDMLVNRYPNTEPWPITSGTVDVVISGSTLEHAPDPFAVCSEIGRVLRPGGFCCIIVPWTAQEHRHPIDCWRILPDGMRELLERHAKLNVLDTYMEREDTCGIAQKGGR